MSIVLDRGMVINLWKDFFQYSDLASFLNYWQELIQSSLSGIKKQVLIPSVWKLACLGLKTYTEKWCGI